MEVLSILAWIIIAASLVKMITILISPNAWINFVKNFYNKPQLTSWIGLILAAVVLYLLINAGITIIEILAVMVFLALLMIAGLASYMPKLLKGVNLKKILAEQWYYVIAWLALIIWGILELV